MSIVSCSTTSSSSAMQMSEIEIVPPRVRVGLPYGRSCRAGVCALLLPLLVPAAAAPPDDDATPGVGAVV
jgi:hypothetical protein